MKDEHECGMGLFADDLMHAMRFADDGIVKRPLCGKDVVHVSAGSEENFVCDDCIPLLGEQLGIDPDEFRAAWLAHKQEHPEDCE